MEESKVKDFLKTIGIDEDGKFEKDKYTIQLENSDEWAKYYTIISNYDGLELSDPGSMSQEYATVLTYKNDDFKVSLNGNLVEDYYTVVIEENKK